MNIPFAPDPLKDQFFLQDEATIIRMVDLAELNKNDTVLEIGAGTGNLTSELAKHAGKVISFEIDPRFGPLLAKLPRNVEVHLEDAWDFAQLHGKFRKKKIYNKIVSNLPYSFCERLMHNLTFLDFDKVILLVPLKFLNTLSTNPIFKSFLTYQLEFKVDKSNFYPQPKTNSAVISLSSLPDPISSNNLPLFLKQYIYQHENQKVINSLREGLIKFTRFTKGDVLSKKQAAQLVSEFQINPQLLETTPGAMIYEEIDRHYSSASS